MRIFIDTNVLISAALFPNGVAANAFERAVSTPNDPIVSDYVIDELRRVFARKFPKKLPALDTFLAAISSCIEIVVTPNLEMEEESRVREPKDRPVYRAAEFAKSDILLTGDKDLLESGVEHTKILTASDFLKLSDN